MTPPNDAVDVGLPEAGAALFAEGGDSTDEILSELADLDAPERASGAEKDVPAASPDLPDAKPDATPVESPLDADAPPTDSTTPDNPELVAFYKDAKPLTYKVDGQERTFDGILEVAGQGAVIAPDQVDRIRNTLGLAEKSIADNRGLYERTQQYERLGGTARIEALEQQVAQLDAAGTKLLDLLKDPTAILMLDEQGNVVKNERAIADLTERLQFVSEKAAFDARAKFQQHTQQVQDTASQGQTHERAFDAVLQQALQQYPSLLPQDLVAAKQHFGQFAGSLFRPATPEDAQRYGYRIGEMLIDTPKMAPWFEDRAALRASAAAQDTKRKQAEDENLARRAAPPVASPRKATPSQPRNKDGTFAEKQAERERIKREMKIAHRQGRFYSDSDTSKDV